MQYREMKNIEAKLAAIEKYFSGIVDNLRQSSSRSRVKAAILAIWTTRTDCRWLRTSRNLFRLFIYLWRGGNQNTRTRSIRKYTSESM